jgi:predicted Rossmann-fold nucleotide-binding protein
LGFHQKPIAVLNVNGYFDKLIEFLEDAAAKGFIKPAHQEMLLVSGCSDKLITEIESFAPPLVDKLI